MDAPAPVLLVPTPEDDFAHRYADDYLRQEHPQLRHDVLEGGTHPAPADPRHILPFLAVGPACHPQFPAPFLLHVVLELLLTVAETP